MSTTTTDTQLSHYVRAHARRLAQLPTDTEFVIQDLPEVCQAQFDRLRSVGVIESTGWEPGRDRREWTVPPRVEHLIETMTERDTQTGPVTPCCGYRGWVNRRDGDFECKLCGDEFAAFAEVDDE